MSLHRAILVATATLFTAGMTSVAFAGCCNYGVSASYAYASSGCGGCGVSYAPMTYAVPVATYAQPIAPAPITVGGCCGGSSAAFAFAPPVAPTPLAYGMGGGCGCGNSVGYAAPAPTPVYVVDQGPEYAGPGIMEPYRTYAPSTAYAPGGSYPYVSHPHRYYPGPRFAYGERSYGHPHYYGPMPRWRPYPYRPLGARG